MDDITPGSLLHSFAQQGSVEAFGAGRRTGRASVAADYALEEVDGSQRVAVEFITRPGCHDYKLEASADLADWNSVNCLEAAPPASLPGGMMRLKWADDEPFGGLSRLRLRQ